MMPQAQTTSPTQTARHRQALAAVAEDLGISGRNIGRRPILGEANKSLRLTRDEIVRENALLRRHLDQLRRIASLRRRGEIAELRSVITNTLNSRASRASALIRLDYKGGYALRYDQVIERITKLDVSAACNDAVTLILKQKDSGASRPTLEFGWRHRARQLMLRDVVYAAGICNEFDFNFRGHGPKRAIDRMVQAIEDGVHFWLTADIKNCFASVKLEHLLGMVPLVRRQMI